MVQCCTAVKMKQCLMYSSEYDEVLKVSSEYDEVIKVEQ